MTGDVVHAVVAGTFGRIAYAVPIALLVFGIRLLRAPEDQASTNRITIGTTVLTFAAAGLVHISAGMPSPPDGALRMRDAGGMIVSWPRARSWPRSRTSAPSRSCC